MNEPGSMLNVQRSMVGVPSSRFHAKGFDLASFLVRRLPPLRTVLALLLLVADSVLGRIKPSYVEHFPVGYFFLGHKFLAGK